ncbi:unnamed protein product, partial [Polarella glacialis]
PSPPAASGACLSPSRCASSSAADEVERAHEAAKQRSLEDTAPPTIFDKIIKKEIPASVVYE